MLSWQDYQNCRASHFSQQLLQEEEQAAARAAAKKAKKQKQKAKKQEGKAQQDAQQQPEEQEAEAAEQDTEEAYASSPPMQQPAAERGKAPTVHALCAVSALLLESINNIADRHVRMTHRILLSYSCLDSCSWPQNQP